MDGEPLQEGATVTILAPESDETFELTPDDEAKLLESIAEADRGETVSAKPLVRDLEPPNLTISRGTDFGESDDVVLAQDVQPAVGVGQRSLANTSVPPQRAARREVECRENGITEAVQHTVDEHDAAVVILHVAREVDLAGAEGAVLRLQRHQPAAGAVRRGVEHLVLRDHRRRDVGGAVRGRRIAPHHLAVSGADADRR